jgi:Arc/MetJ-type ribon-helix-helix transcriptional regulator
MGTNLDIEMKVRITEQMSREIDELVASRIAGTKRSDIVREALSLHLHDQLKQTGQRNLRKAESDFAKAAQAIKGSIPKT